MAVVRVEKTANYTVMSNYHFKEKEMSLKAKGLLSFMLSLPESWDYSISGLEKCLKESRSTIAGILKELEQFGYLSRRLIRDERGKISDWEYTIYEMPYVEAPHTENQHVDNQHIENQHVENGTQINTNKQNTNKKNTNKQNYKAIVDELINDDDVKEALYDYIEMRKMKKMVLTDRALRMLINKLRKLSNDKNEQIQMLDEATVKNWRSVFPLKGNEGGGQHERDGKHTGKPKGGEYAEFV